MLSKIKAVLLPGLLLVAYARLAVALDFPAIGSSEPELSAVDHTTEVGEAMLAPAVTLERGHMLLGVEEDRPLRAAWGRVVLFCVLGLAAAFHAGRISGLGWCPYGLAAVWRCAVGAVAAYPLLCGYLPGKRMAVVFVRR